MLTKEKIKNKKYFPSPFLVIIGLMILFIIISWIGSLTTSNIKALGIMDTFSALWKGFKEKSDVIIFIFSIGGCLAIMSRIQAIDAGISIVVKKLDSKIILLIPILMFIFGIGGSTFGMWEETIAFIPVLVLVFKKTDYGPLVALLIILVGAGTGCLASTINPFSVGLVDVKVNSKEYIGTSITPGIRWVSFIIFEFVSISFVMRFATRIKNKKIIIQGLDEKLIQKRFSSDKVQHVNFTTKRKITLILFGLTFVLMIILYLPWNSWIPGVYENKGSFFSKYFWWFASASKDSSGAGYSSLGACSFLTIASLFLILSFLIFIININDFKSKEHNPEEHFIQTYIQGINDVLSVCLIISVAGGLGVVLKESQIGTEIAKQVCKVTSNMFIFGISVFISSIILSFLVPSSSGFATSFMPIFGTVAANAFPNNIEPAIGIAILGFIFANGIVNLVTPTSAALMGYTAYVGIPYNVWLKYVWKLILILFILSLILILIFSLFIETGSCLF